MRYIKVYDSSGTVVAAEALPSPAFVLWNARYGCKLVCQERYAQGIMSKDGDTAYQLEGQEALPGAELTAVLISQLEYDALAFTLEETATETPEDTGGGETEQQEVVMTPAKMYLRIVDLEAENQTLTQQVAELGEAMDLLLSGATGEEDAT